MEVFCMCGIVGYVGKRSAQDVLLDGLEKLEYPTPTRMAQEKNLPVEAKMFNHGGRRKTVKK
jgi:hypothetical protein